MNQSFEHMQNKYPQSQCSCGDPIEMHSSFGSHCCLRPLCGCTGFVLVAFVSKDHVPGLFEQWVPTNNGLRSLRTARQELRTRLLDQGELGNQR